MTGHGRLQDHRVIAEDSASTLPGLSAPTGWAEVAAESDNGRGLEARSGAAALLLAAYGGTLVAGELAARFGSAGAGAAVDAVVLVAALNHGASAREGHRQLVLGFAMVALVRLLAHAATLVSVSDQLRYAAIAVAMLIALWLTVRRAGMGRKELGLVVDMKVGLWSAYAIVPGFAVGFLYYPIVEPFPWIGELDVANLAASVGVLAVATGIVEEAIFRGLLQGAASELIGERLAVLSIAGLSAVLAVVPWSIGALGIGFVVALGLGALTVASRSIVPAAAAHASLNVALFIVAPLLQAGGGRP